MAIIPKGSFQRRVDTSRRSPRLNTSAAAKPYQAMAQLGAGMAQIAGNIFERAQRDSQVAEANKFAEKYATERASFLNSIQKDIDDDGFVSAPGAPDPISFEQAVAEEEERRIERLSSQMTSEAAKTRFRESVASDTREAKVKAINFAEKHKTQRFISKNKKGVLDTVNTYSQLNRNVNDDALRAHRKNEVAITERRVYGRVSDVQRESLNSFSGATNVESAAKNAIDRGDADSFSELIGSKIFNSKEMRDIITDPENKPEIETIQEFFKRQKADESLQERSKQYEELRKFLTPEKKRVLIKDMLRSLKLRNSASSAGLNIRWDSNRSAMGNYENHTSGGLAGSKEAMRTLVKDSKGKLDDQVILRKIQMSMGAMIGARASHEIIRDVNNPRKVEAIKQGMKSRIQREIVGMFGDDPDLMKLVMSQDSFATIEKFVEHKLSNEVLSKQRELDKSGATYVAKYMPEVTRAVRDVKDPETARNAKLMVEGSQEAVGVKKHKVESFLPNITESIGAQIDVAINAMDDDGAEAVNLITQLKGVYGSDFSKFMNEAVGRKHMLNEVVAEVAWIENPIQMRQAIVDIREMPRNKAQYDKTNFKKDGGKVFNLPFKANALMTSKLLPFLQLGGVKGGKRMDNLAKIAMARFYSMKVRDGADNSDEDFLKAAYDDTVGRMFGVVSHGDSQMIIPRSLKIPDETARAAAKFLLRQVDEVEIDFSELGTINQAYEGRGHNTDAKKQEAFMKEYRDRLVICTPPADGSGVVMRVCLDTHRGLAPIPVKPQKEGDSLYLEKKIEGLANDPDVAATQAESSQAVLNENFRELETALIRKSFPDTKKLKVK